MSQEMQAAPGADTPAAAGTNSGVDGDHDAKATTVQASQAPASARGEKRASVSEEQSVATKKHDSTSAARAQGAG